MKIRFGACEACQCKDSEIEFLRSLARPKPELPANPLPAITFEADQVLSGGEHQTEFPILTDEQRRQEEIDSEAARLLSGQY